eukprot:m.234691 g.234691  ORF g.234691 m.234691 type:complete len:54 (+) comp19719_c0_seq1:39-200(+)
MFTFPLLFPFLHPTAFCLVLTHIYLSLACTCVLCLVPLLSVFPWLISNESKSS